MSDTRTEEELLLRARALSRMTLGDVAQQAGLSLPNDPRRRKGKIGELIERALGASAGSQKLPDFPELGIELKTIPVNPVTGMPLESTFVCVLNLREAPDVDFEDSWVRQKLRRVLWVPVEDGDDFISRRVGEAVLWSPSAEQDAVLRDDYDEIVGLIGIGRVEALTGHVGRVLQVRPKARDGSARTLAFDTDGDRIDTMPRGFYLRAKFTGSLLSDPSFLP